MSGEVPAREADPARRLQPGDVLFFGAHGPKSKPAEVDHAGIYIGSGWFVHSSERGRRARPADVGLVREALRLGSPPARRSRPQLDTAGVEPAATNRSSNRSNASARH